MVCTFNVMYLYKYGMRDIYIHVYISRTLGQCLNAANSSGKNAYRTYLKYLQVSFQYERIGNDGHYILFDQLLYRCTRLIRYIKYTNNEKS